MIVKNIKVQDYSTGDYYYYSDNSGSANSIRSEGGKINNGPGNKPGDPNGGDNKTNTDDKTTSNYRTPTNTGRTSSTTTSTDSTSIPDGDNTDTTSETTPTPTGTGSTLSGFVTSTVTSFGKTDINLQQSVTGNGTVPKNTDAPQQNGNAAGSFNVPGLARIAAAVLAGMVGVGLVL